MFGLTLLFSAYECTPDFVEVDDWMHKQLGGEATPTLDDSVDRGD